MFTFETKLQLQLGWWEILFKILTLICNNESLQKS